MKYFVFFVLSLLVSLGQCEVTVLKQVQTIYDRSPKLRIRGSGFDADEHSIILDISAQGQTSLRMDEDYILSKDSDGDGVILKLLSSRRWVHLEDRTPPLALILNSVKLASNPNKNLLLEPVIVAQVLATPVVNENVDIIYTTATNELLINGAGFMGAKKVDFYFDPPLYVGVGYEVVSPFPLAKEQVVLRLRHGYKWREEPGPLFITSVDTGGGPVKLNGEDGICVALVQADLFLHGVTVDGTATKQVIYHDQPNIIISGSGFNLLGNTLRFANGLLGKGIDYTTTATTDSSISLRLAPGSRWRKNVEMLPGLLTILAVNAGEGFVAVGPTNAAKGSDVAIVFEHPQVLSGDTKLHRTHSHELHIKGTGFTKVLSKPKVMFSPELIEGVDYTLNVLDRTELEVILLDGKAWRSSPGPVLITAINTRGDDAGWVPMAGDGVHVAEVVEDQGGDIEVSTPASSVPSLTPAVAPVVPAAATLKRGFFSYFVTLASWLVSSLVALCSLSTLVAVWLHYRSNNSEAACSACCCTCCMAISVRRMATSSSSNNNSSSSNNNNNSNRGGGSRNSNNTAAANSTRGRVVAALVTTLSASGIELSSSAMNGNGITKYTPLRTSCVEEEEQKEEEEEEAEEQRTSYAVPAEALREGDTFTVGAVAVAIHDTAVPMVEARVKG